jgi:S-adenosylmethionine hydrolase
VSRITLLTDFGTRDGYVGAMKGVMSSIFPGVIVDDVSHDVPPGDIRGAALTLSRYWRLYPPGTVHLAVVDPGVGTERAALAAEADRRFFVAPDNGVLSRVHDACPEMRFVRIQNPQFMSAEPSRTFHGRDVFAPVAGHLALGAHHSRHGPGVGGVVRVDEPSAAWAEAALVGEVVSLDRFGNLVTNLPGTSVGGDYEVEIGGKTIPVVGTYGEVPADSVGAVVNSDGRVEVAARERSAADLLSAGVGTRVSLRKTFPS